MSDEATSVVEDRRRHRSYVLGTTLRDAWIYGPRCVIRRRRGVPPSSYFLPESNTHRVAGHVSFLSASWSGDASRSRASAGAVSMAVWPQSTGILLFCLQAAPDPRILKKEQLHVHDPFVFMVQYW